MISKTETKLVKNTLTQYKEAVSKCRDIFIKKNHDYGTSWRVMRPASLTDQIFIKAKRIQTIQQTGKQKVEDGIETEFVGIINYSIIALIQLELQENANMQEDTLLELDEALNLFDKKANFAMELMQMKNHDYGEAWRDMRVGSFVDLILMKIMRIRQIENHEGKTLISEGISSHYVDIMNYAIFGLIKLSEESNS